MATSPMPYLPSRAASSLGHGSSASVSSFQTANTHMYSPSGHNGQSGSLSHTPSPSFGSSAFPFPNSSHLPSPSMATVPSHAHTDSLQLGTITEVSSGRSSAATRLRLDSRVESRAEAHQTEELGAPTSGVYAQEGLWDDDSDDNNNDNDKTRSWRARLSGSAIMNPIVTPQVTTGDRRSVKSTKSAKSNAGSAGRSRSNTLTAQSVTNASPTGETAPWPWGRKASVSNGSVPPAPVAPQTSTLPSPAPIPTATHPSMSAPRKPSVSQNTSSMSSMFAPSPFGQSPALSLMSSPAASASEFPSQVALPSPAAAANVPKLRQSKSRLRLLSKTRGEDDRPASRTALSPLNVNVNGVNNVSITQVSASGKPNPLVTAVPEGKPKSAWKRGMDRLWRSKSASGLRESFQHGKPGGVENVAPPVPALPQQHVHANQHARLASNGGSALLSPASPLSPNVPSPLQQEKGATGRPLSPQEETGPNILAQLDQTYSPFRAGTPVPNIPTTAIDEGDLDSDPFAAYGVAPPRSRRTSRSPIPADFMPLPPVDRPGIPRNKPSLTNLKSSLLPRLRKSKSMATTRRPGSFFGANRDSSAPPASSPLASPTSPQMSLSRALSPEPAPGLDRLTAEAMGISPLAPPRPLFYDSFDLGESDLEEKDEDLYRPPSRSTSRQRSHSVTSRNADEPPDFLERVATRATTESRLSRPSTSQSHATAAPDLSIETDICAPSVSGSSAEALVTPSGTIPSATVAAAPESSQQQHTPKSERREQQEDEHREHVHHRHVESPSFQDLYEQLGVWPTEQKRSTQGTPRSNTPAASQDHYSRSACTPSLYDSPSWEATISAFPTFDDPVVATTSLDYELPTGGERESMASSNFAIVPTDSCSHSQSHDASPTKPQWNRAHANNSDREQVTGSGLWTSWRDVPRRSGGGSQGSSRNSSRDRRTRTTEGPEGWLDGMDSESESEDEVPLAKMHPEAAAAQQQKLANRVRRREARHAARDAQLRRAQTKSAKGLIPSRPQKSWSGEGGIPADALAGRLERVAVSPDGTPAVPSRAPPRPPRPDRSRRDAVHDSLSRATTLAGRSSTSGQSVRSQMSARATSDSSDVRQRVHSDSGRRAGDFGEAHTSVQHSSHNSPVGSVSHRRPRAHSNASRSAMPTPPPADPTPSRRGTPIRCVVVSHGEPRAVTVDVFPETTARDVLASLRSRGDVEEGNWVVYESFAELGMERQVREFELIVSNVTRGWDATAGNCLVLRETPPHTTFTRSIPETAPFVGGWVQLESKGKWNRRWLEVRGGQIFLSKNEKGKDELHISTLFSDVYTIRKQLQSPQPYVFALKRIEPAASFETKSEHVHYIATDDSTGYKLQSAVFVSRSFALAQANPAIKTQRPSTVPVHTMAHVPQTTAPLQPRKSPQHGQHGGSHGQKGPQPLLDLGAAEPSGFTGRGLIRRI